jgi:hypothetical protein
MVAACPKLHDTLLSVPEEIDRAACQLIEQHLAECDDCRDRLGPLRDAASLCRRLPSGDGPFGRRSSARSSVPDADRSLASLPSESRNRPAGSHRAEAAWTSRSCSVWWRWGGFSSSGSSRSPARRPEGCPRRAGRRARMNQRIHPLRVEGARP